MLELTLILTGLSHLGGSVSAVARLTITPNREGDPPTNGVAVYESSQINKLFVWTDRLQITGSPFSIDYDERFLDPRFGG